MIRLQFRHNNEIFKNRIEAISFLDSLLDDTDGAAPLVESKMGEPLVVTYQDDNGNYHSILAIGKKDGGTGDKVKYEYIDVNDIENQIISLSGNVENTIKEVSDDLLSLSASTIKNISLNDKKFAISGDSATLTIIGSDIKLSGYTIGENPLESIKETDDISIGIGKLESKCNDNKLKIESEANRATSAETKLFKDISQLSADTFSAILYLSAETSNTFDALSAGTIGGLHKLSAETHTIIAGFSADTIANVTAIYTALSGETVRAQSVESGLTTKIDNEVVRATYKESEIEGQIKTLSGNVETKILIEKGNAIQDSKSYTDTIKDELNKSITSNKVSTAFGSPIIVSPSDSGTTLGLSIEKDRVLSVQDGALTTNITLNYENSGKTIQLLGIGNKILSEIDTSEFVLDGMIESVEVVTSGGTDYLVFKFRTEGGTSEIAIETSDLYKQYIAGNGININSANTISIKTNGIGDSTKYLLIDERGIGLQNISTDINVVQTNIDNEKERAIKREDELQSSINGEITRATQEEAKINSSVSNLSSSLTGEIERAKGAESALTVALNSDIASLNEEKAKIVKLQEDLNSEVVRSTAADTSFSAWQNTFYDTYFVSSEITSVTPEQASSQTLLRKINGSANPKIYASNNAADMIYSGTTNLQAQIYSMIQSISTLQAEIEALNNKISEIEANFLKKSQLLGTSKEIKITTQDDNVIVGFADDAVFGPLN